jgi:hypothetical protein
VNGVTITLRALHHGEKSLEKELLATAERHRVEHEIPHVATDIARYDLGPVFKRLLMGHHMMHGAATRALGRRVGCAVWALAEDGNGAAPAGRPGGAERDRMETADRFGLA